MHLAAELRGDAVEPVGERQRLESLLVEGESQALAVVASNFIPAGAGPRQELLHEPRSPVDLWDRMRGMTKMQKIEEWKAAYPSSVPVDDAEEPAALDEQIPVEEITVGESARHVRQIRLEPFSESLKGLRVLRRSGASDDLGLLEQCAALGIGGGQGVEGNEEVHTVG
jgi:hypothetical protein